MTLPLTLINRIQLRMPCISPQIKGVQGIASRGVRGALQDLAHRARAAACAGRKAGREPGAVRFG